MKKTLTVNLGGTVFHIDEDAYQLLDKYLTNLRVHFSKEEGADEIMGDFELRISELLGERVRLGFNVITIENTEEVIKRVGKPEELFGESADASQPKWDEEPKSSTSEATGKKRLMRDPDNRILGGVASGIAAYLCWDVTAVRLLMILLLCIPYMHVIGIVYLVLWAVMPLARTATDKLQMRGESVTLENIGKTVTDGFEKTSSHVNDYISSDKPRSLLHKLADALVFVVGFFLKAVAVLAAVILLPILVFVLFILVMVTFGLMVGGVGLVLAPFGMDFDHGAPIPLIIMGGVSGILLIGIPLFSLAYAIYGQIFKTKPLSSAVKWTLLILLLISMVLCVVYFYVTGLNGWSAIPWRDFPPISHWN